MARVGGVDIPNDKKVPYSIRYIYGIGPSLASEIIEKANVDPDTKVGDMNDAELSRLRDVVERGGYLIEGDLKREIALNIRRLVDIGSYRGLRHRQGLPVRGQRTKTNARSRKGKAKTVAGRRRVTTR